ncbi:hypothetical protein KQI42_04310 [Tissierella sp. MSJ-40]|uniref:Uncharacterized protein n=1 Tax=Tissierella simiarum TaxID=2841534 RepID=A0ABS6E2U2_9FIRM|nr:hypothetical protein [Tissierella simiarum]MBU5437219.1 hypothetical protein [Tissierella simiarum]
MGMLINFLLEGIGVVLIGVLTIFIFLTIHESEHFMGFILNKVNVYAIFIINLFFIKENGK